MPRDLSEAIFDEVVALRGQAIISAIINGGRYTDQQIYRLHTDGELIYANDDNDTAANSKGNTF